MAAVTEFSGNATGQQSGAKVVTDTAFFDSVADFRLATIATGVNQVTIRGYYGAGTPGGGDFLVDRADTTTADNNGAVIVNGDGLRIKRPTRSTLYQVSDYGITPGAVNHYLSWISLLDEVYQAAGNALISFDLPGTYILRNTGANPTNTIPHAKRITISGVDGAIIQGRGGLMFNTPPPTPVNLTADLVPTGQTISLSANPQSLEIIDLICHLSTAPTGDEWRPQYILYRQAFTVARDEDGTLNIQGSKFLFPSAPLTLPDGVTEIATTAQVVSTVPFITIKNLGFIFELQGDNSPSNLSRFFEFHPAYLTIENVTFTTDRPPTNNEKGGYFNMPGLVLNRYGTTHVKNMQSKNSGYTIWLQYGQKSSLVNCSCEFTRHFLTQNNQHDVTVSGCFSRNGGLIDGHGYWGMKVIDCDLSDSFALNNARGNGDLTIENSTIHGPITTGGANSYVTGIWAADAANHDFFHQNFASQLTITGSTITGLLTVAPQFTNVSIKNTQLGAFGPGEVYYQSLTGLFKNIVIENLTDLQGSPILYPGDVTSNVRNIDVVNSGNPGNVINPVFIPAADSANGNKTFIFPLDTFNISRDRYYYPWQSGTNLRSEFANGTTVTIVFLFADNGWPQLASLPANNDRLIFLDITGAFRHQSALDAVEHHQDQAVIRYKDTDNPKLTIEKNFTKVKDGRSFVPLTIAGFRSGGGATQTLPDSLNDWPNLTRLEVDFTVNAYSGIKTNGRFLFSIDGAVMFKL